MLTVKDVLARSTEFLKKKEVKAPRLSAETLLANLLGCSRVELYMYIDRPMSEPELELCRKAIQRKGEGEPVDYIIGQKEFFGATIKLSRDVLIPRQETEILAGLIVDRVKQGVLWDICTGSGCLGIALKKKYKDFDVTLSDISEEALDIARANALENEVDVAIACGDFLEPFSGKKADVIVCNPPYIEEGEYHELEKEVLDFEPKLALVAGDQGLQFYKTLSNQLHNLLNPGGHLFLEIGYQQGFAVLEMFKKYKAVLLQDYAGHNRFLHVEI